ncbi:efflux RND transporter periplasmic adaptor subunit [Paracoccus methylarcula]|nr:efflux RND transporter periplasmic adaptor subunit [Paracoccus methylarcula]
MRALKAVFGLLVILAAAAGGLYVTDRLLASPNATERSGGRSAAPLAVETIPLETMTFSDAVRAVGTARARKAVDLVAEASGRITRIAFRPGAEVAKGDVLLELDDRAEQADLKAAEATLTEAQAAFARQEQLNRTGNASDAAYQSAKGALLRAEAELDRATALLEDRHIRAPFAGVTGLTDLVEGQMVDASTVIATLDDLSVVEVDFSVPETLLSRLETGQQVRLSSAAWPGRIFEGRISRIDTRVDAATRSVALRAEIANDDRADGGDVPAGGTGSGRTPAIRNSRTGAQRRRRPESGAAGPGRYRAAGRDRDRPAIGRNGRGGLRAGCGCADHRDQPASRRAGDGNRGDLPQPQRPEPGRIR